MHTKLFAIAVLGLFCFGLLSGIAEVRAEDDVYVDLSVLDSLGRTPAAAPAVRMPAVPSVSSGPLFPVVKKAEPRKKSAPVKARKKAVKAKKSKPIAPKPEIKAEIKTSEPEDKIIVPQKDSVAPVMENTFENLNDSPFGIVQEETVDEVTVSSPVSPVDVEDQPIVENENPPVIEPMNAVRELPESKEDIKTSLTPVPVAESVFDDISDVNGEEFLEPAGKEENVPQPLIPIKVEEGTEVHLSAANTVSGDNDIVFAEDSEELDDASRRKLDDIVSRFENPSVNKIAINAYNLDDGIDVFRKKRLNLYRAIAVRSYLLNKGYKNFSLKVITITDDVDKKNRVTVEELK